jgi:hypothetical protein
MPQYSSNTPITFTATPLAGLVNNGRAVSDAINNTVNQFNEVDVEIKLKLAASGVSSTGSVVFGWFGSTDGVTYENQLQGANVLESVGFLGVGKVIIVRVRLTNVPAYWKFVVQNESGAAFDATIGNFSSIYAGIYDTNALALATSQVSVVTSATQLVPANSNRTALVVKNVGPDTIYIGGSSVTTLTGFPLEMGGTLDLESFSSNALYGIVPSVTSIAAVIQY